MSFPYSAGIARPNSNAGEFGYRSEDCVVQLHKGHSGRSTDSHVTDVVAPHHRGQRLALHNPRQHLIALMLGELRLPSKPYSVRSHEPGLFGSAQDRMAFELGQSASSFRANNSDDLLMVR